MHLHILEKHVHTYILRTISKKQGKLDWPRLSKEYPEVISNFKMAYEHKMHFNLFTTSFPQYLVTIKINVLQ